MTDYRAARLLVYEFWNEHGSLSLGSALSASAHFESCITNMHRAVRCMIRLRARHDTPETMKDLIRAKPRFAQDRVANRIRHAIQHLDEQVLDGRVPENTPFALMATGKEAPIAEEPGQTLKTIDGIQIGNLEIRFSELCALLVEMGQYAERLCKFERVQQT